MLLTVFLSIVFCGAITLLLISAVAFVQDRRFFSSAPKEAREVIKPRTGELFYGARAMGWVLMILSALTIFGSFAAAIWDGIRSGYSFAQFFLRFALILTIYKAYDMLFFDWFLLCRFRFFQHYYPEVESVYTGRKYGFNLRSQLLKLFVIFPAASAVAGFSPTALMLRPARVLLR